MDETQETLKALKAKAEQLRDAKAKALAMRQAAEEAKKGLVEKLKNEHGIELAELEDAVEQARALWAQKLETAKEYLVKVQSFE